MGCTAKNSSGVYVKRELTAKHAKVAKIKGMTVSFSFEVLVYFMVEDLYVVGLDRFVY